MRLPQSEQGGRGSAGSPLEAEGSRALPRSDALFEALRGWRARTARARGVPAYVVFGDATLAAIAEARPASEAALLDVKGVGARKLEAYGAELLALVAGGYRNAS